jgi:hypothetical protein
LTYKISFISPKLFTASIFMCYKIILMALLAQPFGTKAHDASAYSKTFALNNSKVGPGIISKFYGELQFGAVTIHLQTYDQENDSLFVIERSSNGTDYEEMGTVTSADGFNFQYKDTMPLPTGFYRIKTIKEDTAYSDVMRLSSISGLPQIKVSPALFDAQITVEVDSKINESFNIELTNSEGKVLSSRLVNAEKGSNKIVFDDGISFLYADEYTMSVTGIQYSYSQKLHKK